MFTISSFSRCHFLCSLQPSSYPLCLTSLIPILIPACAASSHMASCGSKGDPKMEPDMPPSNNGTGVCSFGGTVAHVDHDNNNSCAVPLAIEEAGTNMMHSQVWGLKGKRNARTRRAFANHAAQGATAKRAGAFETMIANLLALDQKLQEDPEMTVVTSVQRRVPDDNKATKWAYLAEICKRDDLLTVTRFLMPDPDSE